MKRWRQLAPAVNWKCKHAMKSASWGLNKGIASLASSLQATFKMDPEELLQAEFPSAHSPQWHLWAAGAD